MNFPLNFVLIAASCGLCLGVALLVDADRVPDSTAAAPIIKINQGALEGTVSKSRDGHDYYAHWGIPYAKPPARFQPAEAAPIPGWEGVRDASVPGAICMQKDFFTGQPVTGSEDCLFVNVFTKHAGLTLTCEVPEDKQKELALVPVIVFIHGGAFYNGAGQYRGANYFMDEPVVLVTFNYRLAALGFLNIGEWSSKNDTMVRPEHESEYSNVANGNMGLKDQVLALKWVQENIRAFGGDPGRVTIFGSSAGAASVSYHMISPMSAGLFHRAIAASGSALNPWAITRHPNVYAKILGESLQCPTQDSEELIKCLLEKDASQIIEKSVMTTVWPLDPFVVLLPSIESRINSVSANAFLTEDPRTQMHSGSYNYKVPLMIGVTKNEGLFLHAGRILKEPALTKLLDENWNSIAPVALKYQDAIPAAAAGTNAHAQAAQDEVSTVIRSFYLGTKRLSATGTVQELENVYSDRQFIHGFRCKILLHAKHGGSGAVYPYVFEYSDGDVTLGSFLFGDALDFGGKVLHAEDIKYAFDSNGRKSPFTVLKDSAHSKEFSKKYVKLLVSFAAAGEPNASIFGDNVTWPAVNLKQADGSEPLNWFHIASPSYQAKESPALTARMEFWDNLIKKYSMKF